MRTRKLKIQITLDKKRETLTVELPEKGEISTFKDIILLRIDKLLGKIV